MVELSTPDDPAGTGTHVATVTDLDRLFTAWLHRVYHQSEHSETGHTPAERFHAAESELTRPDPQTLREAFLWQDFRAVSKIAVVSFHGNKYTVDAALADAR